MNLEQAQLVFPNANTDFLLCAAALRRELSIYTTDGDFKHYSRVLKVQLHEPRA